MAGFNCARSETGIDTPKTVVYGDRLAIDVRGLVADQEQGHVGDFGGVAGARERVELADLVFAVFTAVCTRLITQALLYEHICSCYVRKILTLSDIYARVGFNEGAQLRLGDGLCEYREEAACGFGGVDFWRCC